MGSKNRSGFGLVDTMIAMAILFIAMAGILSAHVSFVALRQVNMEKAMARNAVEESFSALRGMLGIVEAYNSFGGGSTGETFDIRGLQRPSTGEPVGRIIVWRLRSSLKDQVNPPQPDPGSSLTLDQDDLFAAQVAFSSSFPDVMESISYTTGTGWDDYLDTNNDGAVDGADDPQLLLITIRIRWRSSSGVRTNYFSTIIGRR
jgi:hypothetical protein